jgi:hypothetical protein
MFNVLKRLRSPCIMSSTAVTLTSSIFPPYPFLPFTLLLVRFTECSLLLRFHLNPLVKLPICDCIYYCLVVTSKSIVHCISFCS